MFFLDFDYLLYGLTSAEIKWLEDGRPAAKSRKGKRVKLGTNVAHPLKAKHPMPKSHARAWARREARFYRKRVLPLVIDELAVRYPGKKLWFLPAQEHAPARERAAPTKGHAGDPPVPVSTPAATPDALCDPLGGTGRHSLQEGDMHMDHPGAAPAAADAHDTCLVTSLRALGVPVPYVRSGPFRALRDGNPMLAPFKHRLEAVRVPELTNGEYVIWCDGHFRAVVLTFPSVVVYDGHGATSYQAVGDIGDPGNTRWFRLCPCSVVPDESGSNGITMQQLWRIEQNRRQAQLRRLFRADLPEPKRRRVAHGLTEEQIRLISEKRRAALIWRQGDNVCPSPPLGWSHPPMPRAPADFLTEQSYPHAGFLGVLNGHARDSRIQFISQGHVYLIDGARSMGSVTGLVHQYARALDADAAVLMMRTGRNWPRAGYLRRPIDQETLRTLASHDGAQRLVELLSAECWDEHAIAQEADAIRCRHPTLTAAIQSLGMEPDEIKSLWDTNRRFAASQGTWMHFTFEAWLNRMCPALDTPEFELFAKYMKSQRGLTAFRTEWTIFGGEEWLAGSIDCVAMSPQGGLILYDWKRSKVLRCKYAAFDGRTMLPPLDHVPDSQGHHYRLQLNAYRFIIEKYDGYRVEGMRVVCTHPDNGATAFVDEVPRMDVEVQRMMEAQRARVRELAAMSGQDIVERDPLGGMAPKLKRSAGGSPGQGGARVDALDEPDTIGEGAGMTNGGSVGSDAQQSASALPRAGLEGLADRVDREPHGAVGVGEEDADIADDNRGARATSPDGVMPWDDDYDPYTDARLAQQQCEAADCMGDEGETLGFGARIADFAQYVGIASVTARQHVGGSRGSEELGAASEAPGSGGQVCGSRRTGAALARFRWKRTP